MLVLAATLAIQALSSMAVLMPAVYVGVAAADIGVDPSRIGVLMAAIYLAAAIATAGCGGLVRRRGALRVSQGALAITAIGLALYVTAVPILVLTGAIIVGAGLGPITPASAHLLIRRTAPERRSLVFSLRQTGVPLGNALAGATMPPLVLSFGWRAATLAMAAVCLAVAAAVEPLRAELDRDADPAARGGHGLIGAYAMVLRSPPLWRLTLGSIGFSSMQTCFSAFVVSFLTADSRLDLAAAGLVLAIAQATAMVARILWGWIADRRIAPRRLLCGLGLAMAASGILFAFVTMAWPFAPIAIVTVVIGATAIGWNGVLLAEVARLAPPGMVGSVTGAVLSLTFLGAVIAPLLFGAIVAWSGYRLAFVMVAAGAAIAAIVIGGSRRS